VILHSQGIAFRHPRYRWQNLGTKVHKGRSLRIVDHSQLLVDDSLWNLIFWKW